MDNKAVIHISNSFVSASHQRMQKLRRLNIVLDHFGIRLESEWILSTVNKFANALSRRFLRGNPLVRRKVRRFIVDGMHIDQNVFKFRPLAEPPRYARQVVLDAFKEEWNRKETHSLCPPLDLMVPNVRKLVLPKALEILLMPECPKQQWNQVDLGLETRT